MNFKFNPGNFTKTRTALNDVSNPGFQPPSFGSNRPKFNAFNTKPTATIPKNHVSNPFPKLNEPKPNKSVSSMITSPILNSDIVFTSADFINPQKFVMTEYVQKFISKFETHGSIDPFVKKPNFNDLCLILYTPAASKHELSFANAQLICSDLASLNLHSMHVIDGTKLYPMATNVQYLNAGVIYLPKAQWDGFASKTHAHVKMEMNFACSPVHLNKLRLAHWLSPFLLTKMSISFQLQIDIYDHFEQFVKNAHANIESAMRVFGSKDGTECGSLESRDDPDLPLDFSRNNICLIDVNDDLSSAERKMHMNMNVFRNSIGYVRKELKRTNGGNMLVQKMRASKVFLLYFDLNANTENRNRKQKDPSVVNTDSLKAFDGFNTVFVIVDSESMMASNVPVSSVEAMLMSLKQVPFVDFNLNYCSDVLMNDDDKYSIMLSCLCKTLAFGGRILISSWISSTFADEKKSVVDTFKELKKIEQNENASSVTLDVREPTVKEVEDERMAAEAAFTNHLKKVETILDEASNATDDEELEPDDSDVDSEVDGTTSDPSSHPNDQTLVKPFDENTEKKTSDEAAPASHNSQEIIPNKDSDTSSSATFDSATDFHDTQQDTVIHEIIDVFGSNSISSTDSKTSTDADTLTSLTASSSSTSNENQPPAPSNSLDDGISASMGTFVPKMMTVKEVEAALFRDDNNSSNQTVPDHPDTLQHQVPHKIENFKALSPVPEEVPISSINGPRQLKVSFDDIMDFQPGAPVPQQQSTPSMMPVFSDSRLSSQIQQSNLNDVSSTPSLQKEDNDPEQPTQPSSSSPFQSIPQVHATVNPSLSSSLHTPVDDNQVKSRPSSVFDFAGSSQSSKPDSGLCTPTASTSSDANQALFYQQFSFLKEYNCTPENLRLLLETVKARLMPMHLLHPEVVPDVNSVCDPQNLSIAFCMSTLYYIPNPVTQT